MPEKISMGVDKEALAAIARVKLGKTVLTTVWEMPAKFPTHHNHGTKAKLRHTLWQ
jgi:hypothetical protein